MKHAPIIFALLLLVSLVGGGYAWLVVLPHRTLVTLWEEVAAVQGPERWPVPGGLVEGNLIPTSEELDTHLDGDFAERTNVQESDLWQRGQQLVPRGSGPGCLDDVVTAVRFGYAVDRIAVQQPLSLESDVLRIIWDRLVYCSAAETDAARDRAARSLLELADERPRTRRAIQHDVEELQDEIGDASYRVEHEPMWRTEASFDELVETLRARHAQLLIASPSEELLARRTLQMMAAALMTYGQPADEAAATVAEISTELSVDGNFIRFSSASQRRHPHWRLGRSNREIGELGARVVDERVSAVLDQCDGRAAPEVLAFTIDAAGAVHDVEIVDQNDYANRTPRPPIDLAPNIHRTRGVFRQGVTPLSDEARACILETVSALRFAAPGQPVSASTEL